MSSKEGIIYRMPMEGVEKVHPSIRLINDYKLIIPPVPIFIIFGRITETEGLILEDDNTKIVYFPDRLGNIVSLTDYIGEGKSGVVYSGILREDLEKIKCEEKVAVKLYKLDILKEHNQIQRIKREFEVGFQLSHPNIMNTFFLSQTNIDGIERYFLIMEYLDGITLNEYIKKNKPLNLDLIVNLSLQLIKAILYLHKNELIHRDLKPDNIMILKNNRLVIMDLGVIKDLRAETSITNSNQFLASVRHSAPEYLLDLKEKQADEYAIGSCLYCMIYGYPIYNEIAYWASIIRQKEKIEVSFSTPEQPSNRNLKIILKVCKKLLLNNPKKRLSLEQAYVKIAKLISLTYKSKNLLDI